MKTAAMCLRMIFAGFTRSRVTLDLRADYRAIQGRTQTERASFRSDARKYR